MDATVKERLRRVDFSGLEPLNATSLKATPFAVKTALVQLEQQRTALMTLQYTKGTPQPGQACLVERKEVGSSQRNRLGWIAYGLLKLVIDYPILTEWNDRSDTTLYEVVGAIDMAIVLGKELIMELEDERDNR